MRGMTKAKRSARGFSLIEVLIALLLLSIGLIAMAAMQTRSIQMNHSAYLASQATYLAYDMADRMRANRQAALAGQYSADFGCQMPAGNSVAAADIRDWLRAICGPEAGTPGLLPQQGGATGGRIVRRADGMIEIEVAWFDGRASGEGGEQVRSLSIEVQI